MDELEKKGSAKTSMRMVEINGVKMEVDMRYVKKIDAYKVGSNVRVLVKKYDKYEVHPGVIVGFEQFESLPTIIIAYIEGEYDPDIKFLHLNSQSEKVEIVPATPEDMNLDKTEMMHKFDKKIDEKKLELADLESKKAYFLKHFNRYFKP